MGRPIKRAYEFKYLGVVFDEDVSSVGIPIFSIYYLEPVKDWECWDASGEIFHHTALIRFTQLIFVLSWIIVTLCGIAAESVTARL